MRFVDRRQVDAPKTLSSKSVENAREDVLEYLARPDKSRQQSRFDFEGSFFHSADVKSSLSALFENRCCYCETPEDKLNTLEVEHFRPLRNAGDDMKSTQLEYYSWLAYDWDNLLLACSTCITNKQTLFPVNGERGGLRAPVFELRNAEEALLIDPCFDSPSEHFAFKFNGGVEPKTPSGIRTIDILQLNSPRLISSRVRAMEALFDALVEDHQLELKDTGAKAKRDRYVFDDRAFGGALTNAFLSAEVEEKKDLKDIISELRSFDPEDRREILDSLRNQNSSSYSTDSDGGLSKAFENIRRAFTSDRKGGEKFRSRALDEMPTALSELSRVSIKNFKIIQNLEINFPEQTFTRFALEDEKHTGLVPSIMILGENATGKSSVLEAIALALIGTKHTSNLNRIVKSDDISPSEFVHRSDLSSKDKNKKLEVSIEFGPNFESANLSAKGSSKQFRGSASPSKIVIGYGARRYFENGSKTSNSVPRKLASLFDPMATLPHPEDWLQTCNEKDFHAAARVLRSLLLLDDGQLIDRGPGGISINLNGQDTPFRRLSVGYQLSLIHI